MSQTLDTLETTPAPEVWPSDADRAVDPVPSDREHEEFSYRPMPVLAPVAGVLGVCSFVAYLGLIGIGLALLGLPISLVAVLVILRSRGALSGMWIAAAGLLLCAANSVGGIALQVYHYNHEVPEGFTRVNFTNQISKLGFVTENGRQTIPPEVEALFGKQIFLKGFVYPTERTEDLSEFLLLKDSGQCCFGGQPALEDMIHVRMAPGKEVDYYSGRVAVAGTFKVNSHYQGGSLEPIYVLDAEHFSKAKTSF